MVVQLPLNMCYSFLSAWASVAHRLDECCLLILSYFVPSIIMIFETLTANSKPELLNVCFHAHPSTRMLYGITVCTV